MFAKQPSQRDFVEPSVPRFFFHLYDDMITADEEGQELVGTLAARERAIAIAREMVCSEVLGGHLNLKHRIEVADESGKIIATVRFKDAVELES